MAERKVTAAVVARKAGVSQSAVSRAFTPGASVSKRTAERVHAAADALGYRPNVLARSLITGKSRIIGLVVTYFKNHLYPEVLERLSTALQAQGYHVLVFMAPENSDNIDPVLEQILDYQVEGLVLAASTMSSRLASHCHDAGIPVVLFNRTQDTDQVSSVTSDNVSGGRKVAELFARCGYQRIAFVAGWQGASTNRDREAGFRLGLESAGLTLCARASGEFDHAKAQQAARTLFQVRERPEAVFVCSDHMAFAVMDVLRSELALRVPEDVAVVGYDDVPMSSWPAYNLTTVQQRVDRMVSKTVDILLQQIDGTGGSTERVAIDGPLVLRGSHAHTAKSCAYSDSEEA